MDVVALRAKAELLRALHRPPPVLVLPNAWDAASARIFAATPGCRALATTSAGIANALGYPDGEHVPREEMLAVVARIAAAVAVPVTADLEAGYGAPAETVALALEAGAVGMNLEDGTRRPDEPLLPAGEAVARVRAARAAADAAGVPFVLNARTDVLLAGAGSLEDALARGRAYLEAGADCVFVPGAVNAETIGALARGLPGPLNVLAALGTPPVAELERLGVARVSVGSGPMRATAALAARIARELLGDGTYDAFTSDAIPYAELNRLMA